MRKTELIRTTNFVFKISTPDDLSLARVGLMLHGWTGDENSMWVFTSQLDDDWLLLAPRAPYESQGTELGGYSWVNQRIDHWPQFVDFLPAIDLLYSDIEEIREWYPIQGFEKMAIFGFSQGAAMSFAYSMLHPEGVGRLGLLSGFLPDNSEGYISKAVEAPLDVFIGHGTQDKIVPIEMAEEGKVILEKAGHSPRACFSDVGHRLGSDCFKALNDFLNQR